MASPDSPSIQKVEAFQVEIKLEEKNPLPDPEPGESEPDSIVYTCLLLLFLGLTVLKQAHVLDWSWWWISLPLWIAPGGLMVVVLVLAIQQEIKRSWRGW